MTKYHLPANSWPEAGGSERLFAQLLDSAPDAMIVVDADGRIFIVNSRAEKMFGYAREQLRNEPIELLVPDQYRSKHKEIRAEYCKKPILREMGMGRELFARRRDGSEFPVEVSLSPLRTDSGLFVSSVIRDITARREMEKQIIGARQEAERANKANSAFLAAASHDLRQPVQALSLLTGALKRTVKEPKALEMVDSLGQSLTAMTNLLNSLLDISRLDAGAVKPELEEFPISLLIERLSSEFSRQAKQNGLDFKAKPCSAIVRSDPNLLSEIIQNFVSNGIRYTNEGSVTLSCQMTDDECRIEIRDTGVGIEPDQIDEIFDEFHQCKSPGGSNEGFGLGLAIVRRLADLLGHHVSVESVFGQGSCFSIAVPAVGVAATDNDAIDRENTVVAPRKGSGFVILVEDDVRVADALILLFESDGYHVGLAASKAEATTIVKHADSVPCLIVSDYHLIGSATGVDTIAAIRHEIGANIPAFIITGDTSELVEERSVLTNCDIMSKPIDPDRLLQLARQAISTGKIAH